MESKIVERKEKPNFVRQDINKTKRLKHKWRKPKGLHSKLRLNKRGHIKKPSQGYRNVVKKAVKRAFNLSDLENNKQIIIASGVGLRKKVIMLKKAQEQNIEVLNVKNIPDFIKNVEEKLNKKKVEKKAKEEKKQKSKKELEEKEEKTEEKKSEEDIKKEVQNKVEIKDTKPVAEAPKQQKAMPKVNAPKQK